ncbi:MAG: potassium transporter Kup [Gemmatimonadota bacterium]|nr:potassium transporter Kup [Gemmatimonadota bacterium]
MAADPASPAAAGDAADPSGRLPSPTPADSTAAVRRRKPTGRKLGILSLTALGVVYGDIGTSPLYAFKQCFDRSSGGVEATTPNVYGILSLIVWTLTLIVSVKYIVFIMRADNRGEGGILALLALIQQRMQRRTDSHRHALLVAFGLFGAALLYGDGVITPAISVLGATEGLSVATPLFTKWVVPLSAAILFVIFLFQKFGTDRVGRIFGPIMLLWFAAISVTGAREIWMAPQILRAIYPLYAIQFFARDRMIAFLILGAVVLAVTGAEALYADMGHFGKRPIRIAWFGLVFPALLVNYFGQGALLLRDPAASANPFYLLVPGALLYPMVVLATVAAVIASQALISGAFSLTQQAMQLGYTPRMTIVHTSKHEAGQIYVPEVNKALMVGCIALVIGFKSSTALASAYGIAVTGTMVITTLLFYVIIRQRYGWSQLQALAFLIPFLTIDVALLLANAVKVAHGGWFPLAVALVIYTLMTTWKRGRELLHDILREQALPMDLFLEDVRRRNPARVPGTAVFMSADSQGAPVVLLHHLKHNKVLHEQVILLSVLVGEVPEVDPSERVTVQPLGEDFFRVIARYGFMQTPNVKEIMEAVQPLGIRARTIETSFYLGREQLILTGEAPLQRWRKKLFELMSRNSRSATQYFSIPPNRVVELGAQIEF